AGRRHEAGHEMTAAAGPFARAVNAGVAALFVCAMCVAAAAQTPAGRGAPPAAAKADKAPAEPAPRWPDGHVNLGSAPGKKGYWEVRPGLGGFPRAADVPLQPWARALSEYRTSRIDLYPPLVSCKPSGGPSFFNAPGLEIVDAPD